jgi:hypothetical protein
MVNAALNQQFIDSKYGYIGESAPSCLPRLALFVIQLPHQFQVPVRPLARLWV